MAPCAFVINSACPVRDAQGSVTGCAVGNPGHNRGRKRTEDALRESEERFRFFMDNNPTIAWMKDEQGRHVYFNKTYEIDLASDWRTVGQDRFEVWPKETAEEFRKNDQAVLAAGHAIEVMEETVNPDGSLCRWLIPKFSFRDLSGKHYVAGIGLDITERKRAEEAVRESEARFKLLSETAGRLLAAEDPQEIVNDLCRAVMEHLDCQACFHFLVDEEQAGSTSTPASASPKRRPVKSSGWTTAWLSPAACPRRGAHRSR